jgi:hypothetical protein
MTKASGPGGSGPAAPGEGAAVAVVGAVDDMVAKEGAVKKLVA